MHVKAPEAIFNYQSLSMPITVAFEEKHALVERKKPYSRFPN